MARIDPISHRRRCNQRKTQRERNGKTRIGAQRFGAIWHRDLQLPQSQHIVEGQKQIAECGEARCDQQLLAVRIGECVADALNADIRHDMPQHHQRRDKQNRACDCAKFLETRTHHGAADFILRLG